MDLHVKFTGLCLFVPDVTARRMRVLIPSHHEGGAHVDPHEVKLNYRGGTPNLDMEKWFLDLSGAGGTGDKLTVGDFALDAGARAERRVDSKQWSKDARKSIVSHVTLPRASELEPGRPVNWLVRIMQPDGTVVDEFPRDLTHHVTYVIKDVDAGYFKTWQRHPLRPKSGDVPEHLPEPIPTGDIIILEVTHLPKTNVPLKKGQESTHFQAFHNVFKVFPGKKAHVFLNEDPPKDTEDPPSVVGGSPFNCMLAQSQPE
ncbi:MAG TPA: hypothetical protein VFQ76_22085 [Longimicrobiaceae bacterium]|nr:hypothetical protein [Longimicrobiaceae bacterium]